MFTFYASEAGECEVHFSAKQMLHGSEGASSSMVVPVRVHCVQTSPSLKVCSFTNLVKMRFNQCLVT